MDSAKKNLVIETIQAGHVIAIKNDNVPEVVAAVRSAGLVCHAKPTGNQGTHQQITPGHPVPEPEIPPFTWQITSLADREDEAAKMQDLTRKLMVCGAGDD